MKKRYIICIMLLLAIITFIGCTNTEIVKKEDEISNIKQIETTNLVAPFKEIDLEYWRVGESLYVKNNSSKVFKVELTFLGLKTSPSSYTVTIDNLEPGSIQELTNNIIGEQKKVKAFETFSFGYGIIIIPEDYIYSTMSIYDIDDNLSQFNFLYDEEKKQYYYYEKDKSITYCTKNKSQNIIVKIDTENRSSLEYGNNEDEEQFTYDWYYKFDDNNKWIKGGTLDTIDEIKENLNV